MNGRYENGALPEKVRLLYEAVLAMVTNGWDINRMKVSDITAQAGIGKGTAYEYFSSKEEIIANASSTMWRCGLRTYWKSPKVREILQENLYRFLLIWKRCSRSDRRSVFWYGSELVRMRSLSPCAGNVKRDSRLWAAIWRIGLWSP